MKLSEEVTDAQAEGKAVVALESTIIAHGFPRPDNLAVGQAMEHAVRTHGAVPATIAIFDGRVHVGLSETELVRLAEEDGLKKTSTRDLAAVLAARGSGATTVATTAFLAHRAGIDLFATGGIGGVHPAADGQPADVSADLYAMQSLPIGIVSAGAKSILDLPATLEMLESFGVPVVGYGTDEFPAFHTAVSGLPLAHRFDDPADVAKLLLAHRTLGLTSSVLIANPPPAEAAIAPDLLAGWLVDAHAAAARAGVSGSGLTPWLLAHLNVLSDGATRRVNHALAVANAGLAARIAVKLAALK